MITVAKNNSTLALDDDAIHKSTLNLLSLFPGQERGGDKSSPGSAPVAPEVFWV